MNRVEPGSLTMMIADRSTGTLVGATGSYTRVVERIWQRSSRLSRL